MRCFRDSDSSLKWAVQRGPVGKDGMALAKAFGNTENGWLQNHTHSFFALWPMTSEHLLPKPDDFFWGPGQERPNTSSSRVRQAHRTVAGLGSLAQLQVIWGPAETAKRLEWSRACNLSGCSLVVGVFGLQISRNLRFHGFLVSFNNFNNCRCCP